MKVSDWIKKATEELSNTGITSARLDSLLLLGHFLEKDKTWILANPEYEINDSNELNELLNVRKNRIPLAYITKEKEFFGLKFYVDKRVMIPRPETESLVEYAIENIPKNSRIIELGTGSGAISISIAKKRPDLHITAVDISEDALKVAEINKKSLSVTNVNFINNNLLKGLDHNYSWLVANLPYVDPDHEVTQEAKAEPKLALYAENKGLKLYKEMFNQLNEFKEINNAVIEAEPFQKESLIEIASASDYKLIEQDKLLYVFSH